MLALAAPPPVAANTPEAQVKAAYLFNFASFVRWPEARGAGPFRLCVAGRSDVAQILRQLVRNQAIDGRPIEIMEVSASQADRAATCSLLFLGRGAETARSLRAAVRGRTVLTVGDRGSGTRGGAIDFAMVDGRVRFIVNRETATAQGLGISSKLLDVAWLVE